MSEDLSFGEKHGTAEGGPHIGPLTIRQRKAYRFTFALFIWIEFYCFVALWALRLLYPGRFTPAGINYWVPIVGWGMLVFGLPPLWYAEKEARRWGQKAVAKWAGISGLFAIPLLACVAYDWYQARQIGIAPSSHYGDVFYVTLGVFAVLVAAHLVGILGIVSAGLRGRTGEGAVTMALWHWAGLLLIWSLTTIFLWGV